MAILSCSFFRLTAKLFESPFAAAIISACEHFLDRARRVPKVASLNALGYRPQRQVQILLVGEMSTEMW